MNNNLSPVCGDFQGYWSADQICAQVGLSDVVSTYFQCAQGLPTPYFPAGATYSALMACAVPTGDIAPTYNSCYLNYSGFSTNLIQTCCGCADWWNSAETSGQTIGANSNTQSCTPAGQLSPQTDPEWNQHIQPKVQWMKAACPSVYVYPFDDKTSGFSCTNNLPAAPNSTGYTVTFCQGNAGAPPGITDGR